MKEEEFVRKYGRAVYEKKMQQGKNWREAHPEEMKALKVKWALLNPEKVKAHSLEGHRKGSNYYEKHKLSHKEGLSGEKYRVRVKHQNIWRPYKQIIAPESQIHHEWVPNSADYRGVALVEKEQHQHGVIDVIEILEGKITLFTEAEIRQIGK